MSTTMLAGGSDSTLNKGASSLDPPLRNRAGLSVCHLTSVQDRLDTRAYVMEMLPLTKDVSALSVIGAHGRNGKDENVEFISVPTRQNRTERILLACGLAFQALHQPSQLYHIHNPETIPAGLVLKWFGRKKVVYDTEEDHPSMMLTKAYLPRFLRPIARSVVAGIERLAARTFDGYIAADSGTLRANAKVGRSRKLVFYNLPNLDFFPSPETHDKRFDLVYRGGLSERAGTFVLLAAVRELLNRGLHPRLLLFGYTDSKADQIRIAEHIQRTGLSSNVELGGRIDHGKMAATLSLARVSVCPLLSIPKFRNNIPVKVFESWACGVPVVCSDLPPIRPFFKGTKFGMLVKPGSIKALADALEGLLTDPEETARMGRAARRAVVERYNNAHESRKLLAFYKRILREA